MQYTVTVKLLFPSGLVEWAVRYVVEASCESDAVLNVKIRLAADAEFKDCVLIEARVWEYQSGDEHKFVLDKERWELEEETKTAPARIARALDRMAENMAGEQVKLAPTKNSTGLGYIILIIANLAATVALLILKITEG